MPPPVSLPASPANPLGADRGDIPLSKDRWNALAILSGLRSYPQIEIPGPWISLRQVAPGVSFSGKHPIHFLSEGDLQALGSKLQLDPVSTTANASPKPEAPPDDETRSVQSEGTQPVARGEWAQTEQTIRPCWHWLSRVLGWGRPTADDQADPGSDARFYHPGDWYIPAEGIDGAEKVGPPVTIAPCVALEIHRELWRAFQDAPAFQEALDQARLHWFFDQALVRIPLFAALTPEQRRRLRQAAEWVRYQPGEVIFEENDLSDALGIIARGQVRVVKGETYLLALGDVLDWPLLLQGLTQLQTESADPSWKAIAERIAWNLPDEEPTDPASAPDAEKQEWLHRINDFFKQPWVDSTPDGLPVWPDHAPRPELLATLPVNPADWSPRQKTAFARAWLEAVLAEAARALRPRSHRGTVLATMGKGDLMGEMGVLADQPRSATCEAIASSGPDGESGPTEMVRIAGDLFTEILADAPAVCEMVVDQVARRSRNDRQLLAT